MAARVLPDTKTCPKCGETKPRTPAFFTYYTSPAGTRCALRCHPCNRAHVRDWKQSDPERAKATKKASDERCSEAIAARKRDYYEANKGAIADYKRIWFAANKARRYAYVAGWNEQNRERVRGYGKAWRVRHPDRFRAHWQLMNIRHGEKRAEYNRRWLQENREAANSLVRTRRARQKACGGKHTGADIQRQLNGQKGHCWWCQKKLTKYHVDHRIPLKRGGSNGPENIVISCPRCNQKKSAKLPWQIDNPRLL